jgi:O-antigen/teichoic acid export membrane protein
VPCVEWEFGQLSKRLRARLIGLFQLVSAERIQKSYSGPANDVPVNPSSHQPDISTIPAADIPARSSRRRQLPLISALRERLRADHMVRNSLYLILNSGLQAGLGFAFWIIAARLFTTADVGRASSLIAATVVLAYVALLGLNTTFVRYLPTAHDRDAMLTVGLLLVAAAGAGLGLLYVLLTPVIAPRVAFIEQQPVMTVGFVLLTAAGAVNLITDSVFIAGRKAGYNALVDGGLGGLAKVGSTVILVGTGAYGLFCASAAGSAAAALASILLMTKALRWRPALRKPFQTLLPLLRFSGATYVGNVLNLLPILVVPLIVLDRLGASAAAYYFVAFQIANLLYSAAYAIEQAFLAEGSQAGVDWRELVRRSLRVLIALCLPAGLVLFLIAHWLLLMFGSKYSQHGTAALMVLAVAVIPVAANCWLQTVLRLSGRLRAIVVSNSVYAVAICGLAWFLAPHGLTGLAAAWPVGALLGAAAAAMPAKSLWPDRSAVRRRHGWRRSVWPPHRVAGRHHAARKRRWWPALTALTVTAAGVSLALPGGRHQWALSLIRQPTRYTALSFDQAQALPATATKGEAIRFSFSVGNQEGHAVGYRYVLSASGGGSSRVLDESERTLAAGATWKVSAAVRPTCGSSPCRIEVTLPGHPEKIDFLVTLKAQR